MTPPEHTKDAAGVTPYTGRDVIYRDGAINAFDVQRAADALLRQGIKPSVAAIREQLGGGSPNTLTPLLSKYWESLGQRLSAGPESLERVPENLARVTELVWRRALEEARERLKMLAEPDVSTNHLLPLQDQVLKLSVALAEARAREGEQLSHLASLSRERESLRSERGSLVALLKSTQSLLEQQNARVAALVIGRTKELSKPRRNSARSRTITQSPRRRSLKRFQKRVLAKDKRSQRAKVK